MCLYNVDDILVASNKLEAANSFKSYLHDQFNQTQGFGTSEVLGLEIARSAKGIHLCHRKYTLEFMEEAEVLASKPAKFPMDQNCRLSKTVVSYYKMLLNTGG